MKSVSVDCDGGLIFLISRGSISMAHEKDRASFIIVLQKISIEVQRREIILTQRVRRYFIEKMFM